MSKHIKENETEERSVYKEKDSGKGKKTGIIVAVIVAVIAIALSIAGFAISKSDVNLPNVYVGDIDVGKLTKAETTEKLTLSGWEKRTTDKLTVTTFGNQTFEVDPVESGMVLTVEKAADAAYSYGHTGNIYKSLFTFVKCLVSHVDVNELFASASDVYLDKCLSDAETQINEYLGTEPYEVNLEDEKLHVKKGYSDLKVDKETMKSEIIEALSKGETSLTSMPLSGELSSPDFTAIHAELEREPEDAYYTDDNTFTVVDEIVGCRFDASEAQKMWNEALPGEEIEIPLEISWPEVTGEELRNRIFGNLLGAMTTEFPASAAERVSNVALCASKIDGTVVYPGETFSYNDIVGPRTEEAGFKIAPAYVDGEVKDEVGGGACQVASTTYAATLFAFLETVDRTCHQFPVSYMQLGTDATVAWPEDGNIVDFKFKNNKNYPIKIVATCDTENKNITVEIWGTLEDDDYMPVEFDNRYTWVNTYDRVIEPAFDDRPGYIIKLTHDLYTEDGYQMTQTHRKVIDSEGNEVLDEVTNTLLPNGQASMDTYYKHPE